MHLCIIVILQFCSPINFGEETKRMWAYGAVFVVLGRRIFDLFPSGDLYTDSTPEYDDLDWMAKWGWVRSTYNS